MDGLIRTQCLLWILELLCGETFFCKEIFCHQSRIHPSEKKRYGDGDG